MLYLPECLLDNVSYLGEMVIRIFEEGEHFRVVGLHESQAFNMPEALSDEGLYLDTSTDPKLQNVRAECNIARAKSRIRELAFCNPWEWFVTLTVDPKRDRYELSSLKQVLRDCSKDFSDKYRLSGFFEQRLKYLLVPEQHKDGAWHFHGLFHNVPGEALEKNRYGYFDIPYIAKRLGYVCLSPVRNSEKVASYITKYVSKDLGSGLKAGEHLFFASIGLNHRRLVYQYSVDNADSIPWQWQNDFCRVWNTKDLTQALSFDNAVSMAVPRSNELTF